MADFLLAEGRGWTMDWVMWFFVEITAETIDWLAEDVKHTAKGLLADWNADRRAGVDDLHAAD